jgi:hypothetical protein
VEWKWKKSLFVTMGPSALAGRWMPAAPDVSLVAANMNFFLVKLVEMDG